MASALAWTVSMRDQVSGIASKVGGSLDRLNQKFRTLNSASELPKPKGLGATPGIAKPGGATPVAGASDFGGARVTAFLRQLGQISPRAAQAGQSLRALAGRADSAMEAFGGLKGVLGSVGGALMSIGAMALKAAAVVGAAFLAMGAAGARYIVQMQAVKQATMFSLGVQLGAGNAAAGWDRITASAIMTGTAITDIAPAFTSLLAQGFKIGEVDALVRRMADLKAINPSANIEGIARAMSQIKATGRLQGDELMQLNEAGLSSKLVYEELAKTLGKSVPEIKKMQEAGQITDVQAIDAIQKAMAKQTGGKAPGAVAAEAASQTLMGGFGRLMARIQAFASGLKIDFSGVARFFDRIGTVLEGDAGKKFGASIENAFAKVIGLLDTITEKDIAHGFEGAAQTIDKFAAGAQATAGAIQTVDGWLSSVSSKTSVWGIAFDIVKNSVFGFVDAIALVAGYISWFWSTLSNGVSIVAGKIAGVVSMLSGIGISLPGGGPKTDAASPGGAAPAPLLGAAPGASAQPVETPTEIAQRVMLGSSAAPAPTTTPMGSTATPGADGGGLLGSLLPSLGGAKGGKANVQSQKTVNVTISATGVDQPTLAKMIAAEVQKATAADAGADGAGE